MLIKDWVTNAPTPTYYKYPPRLYPHHFMGLGKFVAGTIHQMRATKSYLSAHTWWFTKNPSLTCPRCETNQETFEHAILHCLARSQARNHLLKEVDSIEADSTIWTKPHHLKALGQYIMSTKTGFPPEMTTQFFSRPPTTIPPHPL